MEAPKWEYRGVEININEDGNFTVPEAISGTSFHTLYDAKMAIVAAQEYQEKVNRKRKKTVWVPMLDQAGNDIFFESYDRKTGEPVYKNAEGRSVNVTTAYLWHGEAKEGLRQALELRKKSNEIMNRYANLKVFIPKAYNLDTVERHDKALADAEQRILRVEMDYAAKKEREKKEREEKESNGQV